MPKRRHRPCSCDSGHPTSVRRLANDVDARHARHDDCYRGWRSELTLAAMSSSSQHVAIIGAGPAGLMAAEVLAQGGAQRHRLRRDAVGRPQVPDGRARRAQPDAQRTAAGISRALPRGDAASRSRHRSVSAAARCATGARRWGSRPSSAPAAGCFQKPSRPRPCCARGCGGWMRWACNWRCAIAGPAGTSRAVCCFKRRMDRSASRRSATVLALGGASWPRLGSDGAWVGDRSPPRA